VKYLNNICQAGLERICQHMDGRHVRCDHRISTGLIKQEISCKEEEFGKKTKLTVTSYRNLKSLV